MGRFTGAPLIAVLAAAVLVGAVLAIEGVDGGGGGFYDKGHVVSAGGARARGRRWLSVCPHTRVGPLAPFRGLRRRLSPPARDLSRA